MATTNQEQQGQQAHAHPQPQAQPQGQGVQSSLQPELQRPRRAVSATPALAIVAAVLAFIWIVIPDVIPRMIFSVFFLFVVAMSCWKVVPARRCAIVESMGVFSHVLLPGSYFLVPFFQRLRPVQWSHPDQSGHPRVIKKTLISFENAQMDIPPVRCQTKDSIQVTVDGTVMYNITNPERAVYHTDDGLNLVFQCVWQGVRNVIAETPVDALFGQDNVIGERVTDYVNRKLSEGQHGSDTGFRCNQFLVQHIDMDERILEATQEAFAVTRKQQAELQAQQAKHEMQMAALKQEALQQEARLGLERARLEAETQNKLHAAKADAEQQASIFKTLMDTGLTADDVVELKRCEAMKLLAASPSNTKVVYAPLPLFTSGSTAKTLSVETF